MNLSIIIYCQSTGVLTCCISITVTISKCVLYTNWSSNTLNFKRLKHDHWEIMVWWNQTRTLKVLSVQAWPAWFHRAWFIISGSESLKHMGTEIQSLTYLPKQQIYWGHPDNVLWCSRHTAENYKSQLVYSFIKNIQSRPTKVDNSPRARHWPSTRLTSWA